MDFSQEVMELLKIVLPALIVFGAAFLVMRTFMQNEHKKQVADLRKESLQITTPIRLQAYERLVLLMERINPENLVMRVMSNGISAKGLQQAMITTIRTEFDHNISQQLYVSPALWEEVKQTRDHHIQLVNLAASKLKADATGLDLSKVIFTMCNALEDNPSDATTALLKQEIRKVF